MKRLLISLCLLSGGVFAAEGAVGADSGRTVPSLPDGAALETLITDARLPEISGIAQSRRHPDILWMHNDSHNPAVLYAVDFSGVVRGSLTLPVRNVDWEDIAGFEHQGKSYLLVADTGDNGGLRSELSLHIVAEPDELDGAEAAEVRTIRFRWPDGPRDCESVAVDMHDGSIWLVSKKRVPPELFRLPLFPDKPDEVQVAEKHGELSGIRQPSSDDLKQSPVYGKYRSQMTAADISRDGRWLAAMNYTHVYLWPRHPDGWGAAVARKPLRIDLPWMAQAEAMGFDSSGHALWISSEHLPAPLVRMDLMPHWPGKIGDENTPATQAED